MNFYKHFLGDYARDTAHLSMLEHGAYRLMLDHYYATGKSLPADKALLYRICKASSKTERAAVDLVADEFFAVNGDGTRHNHRADKEIGQWAAQAAVNREVGKLGGRPKKTESVTESVSQSVSESEPNRNPSHSQNPDNHKNQKTKTSPAKARAHVLPENFGISDRVRDWAAREGHNHLEKRLAHFTGYAKANAKTYADWDQAFMNAIRDDWAKLNNARSAPNYELAIESLPD